MSDNQAAGAHTGAIAVLGAMPEEVALLLQDLTGREDRTVAGVAVHAGEFDGVPVLIAVSGVGKVNAAATAQALLVCGARSLVFTGVAGALDPQLRTGDLLIGTDAFQYDVDVTALGYERARIPGEPLAWSSDPDLVALALAAAAELPEVRVTVGRIATGDRFLANSTAAQRLHEDFGAACVEMEGAAVAQVCSRAGVPFVIIRSVSDSADESAELSFREFTDLAARRAKSLVRGMLARLREGDGNPAG